MRVAVISDIHSDLSALQRVLSAIEQARLDETWCLGDIVGLGGNAPVEVVDLVRERSSLVLAGNHDRWVTGPLPLDMLSLPRQRSELAWQRTQLSTEQLEWLSDLRTHARRGDIELWHASAEDPVTGWISSEADATVHLALQRSSIGLVGHTHRPMIARLREQGISWNQQPHREELRGPGRAVLNPGAVTAGHRWLELDIDARLATWRRA